MSDLDRIIRFALVAQELSFSRAAARLNVDQPWLSRQIQQLETQIGYPLFQRNTRHVALTAEGEAALQAARDLVAAADNARAILRQLGQERSANLTLGVSASSFWVPGRRALLDRFASRYPRTHINIVSEPSARLMRLVKAGEIDCGILLGAPSDPELEWVVLYRANWGVLVPAENPLAASPIVRPEDLRDQPLAVNNRALAVGMEDPIYAPFLSAGAAPVLVPEGRAAMHHQARERRLLLVSLGWPYSDEGVGDDFTYRKVEGLAADVAYGLARLRGEERRPLDQFWRVACEVSAELSPAT